MIHDNVSDILEWVERNADRKITVAELEKISGYGRRHLTCLFIMYTGHPPGRYVRYRKLSRAAFWLRLTTRPSAEIAFHLGFDSQASFCRAFQKMTGLPPEKYRSAVGWDFSSLVLPCHRRPRFFPAGERCSLPPVMLTGKTVRYTEKVLHPPVSAAYRRELAVSELMASRQDVFMVTRFSPSSQRDDEVCIDTFVGRERAEASSAPVTLQMVSGGEYIRFLFCGSPEEYAGFSRLIYHYVLPELKVVRRPGADIERFIHTGEEVTRQVVCHYFVPVMPPAD
ncbi:TPA: helix-turn-helix domain-containing protein [Salmonella enterica subsp. enterica serovar Kottbus]